MTGGRDGVGRRPEEAGARLQSMTGFARTQGEHAGAALAWEVKSVNGKSVELRLRLPPGYERLEQQARAEVQKRFARGNFQATLTVARPGAQQVQLIVNDTFLREVAALAQRLQSEFGASAASADGLLGLKGVLEMPELVESEEDKAAFDAAAIGLLALALTELEAARQAEGAALKVLLEAHIDAISGLTARAEADPSREPAAIRQKLADQVRMLLDASGGVLDDQRLYLEASLLAAKADIREEIDRLKTHVVSARQLLANGTPAGRRLDFLAQEFNRESNTLCSKANAAAITAIGLDLKAIVDQFREQVQNLE